jgi:V/A-type H+-transporting ATPase subunit A
MSDTSVTGRITRISGPIVYAEGLGSCGLYDVVDVGNAALIGEIIRLKDGIATIQVYEDDTGMRVGEKAVCHRRPLSVRLGPGLVGTIYDGIQRPLKSMFDASGAFLLRACGASRSITGVSGPSLQLSQRGVPSPPA